eukprot:scaffold5242_cov287-Chaetoceros_neogracile.AAC.13
MLIIGKRVNNSSEEATPATSEQNMRKVVNLRRPPACLPAFTCAQNAEGGRNKTAPHSEAGKSLEELNDHQRHHLHHSYEMTRSDKRQEATRKRQDTSCEM